MDDACLVDSMKMPFRSFVKYVNK